MRLLLILPLLSSAFARAQPSLSFTIAEDRGIARPLHRSVTVIQYYRERIPYFGINDSYLGPEQVLTLQGGPLFRDTAQHWMVFSPVDGVAEAYVQVMHGPDTMRVDLPEDPKPLIERAWRRGERDTPEVIRLRRGRHAMETLVTDPWAVAAANAIANRLIAEDDAAYKKELAELEEHYRNLPPPAPPSVPYLPPPPLTQEQWEAEMAKQPGLEKVEVERIKADTVWVRITGRVMLNGGCASGMPLFGVEMLTDTGWVERIPFELSQMDCGMPWGDWHQRVVMIPPLRWWVAAHQPEGKKELRSGSYRLVFTGGNMKQVRTEPFTIVGR